MLSFHVVEKFDVLEEISSGLFTRQVDTLPDALVLKKVEEIFRNGVAMTVASTTHGAHQDQVMLPTPEARPVE